MKRNNIQELIIIIIECISMCCCDKMTAIRPMKLPQQLLPHELNNVSLDDPVLFFPQPFSYPGYPVVLYL